MKSASERYNAIMNGEDMDQETPSIDVEINVIQKEVEAEEAADEMNEDMNEVEDTSEGIEKTEESVEEAEMLVKILKEDGINPLALKILSTNTVYTDTWKIALPSTESLDSTGMNKSQADQIAASLESKISVAKEGIKQAWASIVEKVKSIINKFFGNADKNAKNIETLVSGVNNNKEKIRLSKKGNDTEVSALTEKKVKEIRDAIAGVAANWDMSGWLKKGLKGAAQAVGMAKDRSIPDALQKIRDLKTPKEKIKYSTIADDIANGDSSEYYKAANDAYSYKSNLDDKKKEFIDKIKEDTDSWFTSLVLRYVFNGLVKYILLLQRQYISLSSMVLKKSGVGTKNI